jgi:hypothetical protein
MITHDTNTRIKTFKLFSTSDDKDFNEWMGSIKGTLKIKDIKELATKEYLIVVVYYTEIDTTEKNLD